MPVGLKGIPHAGGHFRLADRSSASLPHLATRDMGHPQFPGPKETKQIFLVRMFFIFLGGPKAHDPSGRDDKGRGLTHLESCYSDGESFETC